MVVEVAFWTCHDGLLGMGGVLFTCEDEKSMEKIGGLEGGGFVVNENSSRKKPSLLYIDYNNEEGFKM